MNRKLFNLAMIELEQLHWHLHLNGGSDLWTSQLLSIFRKAAQDEPDDHETMYLGASSTDTEPPQPAAGSQQPGRRLAQRRPVATRSPELMCAFESLLIASFHKVFLIYPSSAASASSTLFREARPSHVVQRQRLAVGVKELPEYPTGGIHLPAGDH